MSKSEIFNFSIELGDKNHLPIDMILNLIENLMKFLLLQRLQLPLSFDRLKEELLMKQQESTAVVEHRYKFKSFNLINDFILKFEEIFLKLNDCFNKNKKPQINKILIIIGGSIVTPKESYYLNLNSYKLNHRYYVPVDDCFIKKFFRAFVCFLQTIQFKDISSSPIYFLFEAERCESIKWFLPKLNYTPILNKGKQIHVTIDTNSILKENNCDDHNSLSFDSEQHFNISGIEPLNQTLERVLDLNVNDLIWYQSPTVLKGLKNF